jgi:hypothetical protein
MPPARRSATKTTAARASSARKAVRARAASTRAATRREVEQSIARFEKQLEGANDALKTLGTHLGRGAQGSYKEVTSALVALRREATKTNKQALKDFDKLRSAVTHKPAAAKSNTRAKASTAKTSTAKKSSGSAKASSSTTRKRATTTRTTAKRSTASRAKTTRAKKTS